MEALLKFNSTKDLDTIIELICNENLEIAYGFTYEVNSGTNDICILLLEKTEKSELEEIVHLIEYLCFNNFLSTPTSSIF